MLLEHEGTQDSFQQNPWETRASSFGRINRRKLAWLMFLMPSSVRLESAALPISSLLGSSTWVSVSAIHSECSTMFLQKILELLKPTKAP